MGLMLLRWNGTSVPIIMERGHPSTGGIAH
jgi:hypothetical protein